MIIKIDVPKPSCCLDCPFHDVMMPYNEDMDCECMLMGMVTNYDNIYMCNEVNVRVTRPEWCPITDE